MAGDAPVEVRTHTALHVLKGAVVKVLGAKWTAGVWVNGARGRLTVQFDRKPEPEELSMVEEEANGKIDEDASVEEHEMSRVEAEDRWGDAIYDLFPLPASITRTATTGEIGHLKIAKTRHRPSKQLLEISFEISSH